MNTRTHRSPRPTSSSDVSLSISTIIPTVGRNSLARAVDSVLSQEVASDTEIEVIVVNDSGGALESEPWQESPRVRIIETGHTRGGQTAARNLGSSVARGTFFHFLDDDDWMLPGAFRAFEIAHRNWPTAEWLYGVVERVDRDGRNGTLLPVEPEGNVLAEIISGEWMPLQATLLHRELFARVGGFNADYVVSEDMELLMRLARVQDMYRVRRRVCVYSKGNEESTTRRELCREYLYRAYESLFDQPKSIQRAVDSADTPHLMGKVVRQYLLSLRDNLRRGRFREAMRRARALAYAGVRAGRYLGSPVFWGAVLSNHAGMKPLSPSFG